MGDVTGRVKRILSKPAGRGTVYNLQMDDGQYYGFGFNAPNFGEGAEITFNVQWNGNYANVVEGSVQVLGGGHAPQQHGGYQQQGGGNNGGYNRQGGGGQRNGGGYQQRGGSGNGRAAAANAGKDDYWRKKEERDVRVQRQIQHQASRNAAIAVVDLLLREGACPLPTKKADQMDAVMALVSEITERFDFEVDAVGIAADGNARGAQPHEPNGVDDDMGYGE